MRAETDGFIRAYYLFRLWVRGYCIKHLSVNEKPTLRLYCTFCHAEAIQEMDAEERALKVQAEEWKKKVEGCG